MHWVSLLTLAFGVFILLIGFRIYLLDTQNKSYQLFFIISGMASWITFCWYEISKATSLDTVYTYFQWNNIWVFIIPVICLFLWRFSGFQEKSFPQWLKVTVGTFVFAPAAFFFITETFVKTNIQVIQMANGQWGMTRELDMLGITQAVWIFMLDLLSIYLFVYFYQNGEQNKTRKKYALIIFVIAILSSFAHKNILPYLGIIVPINESFTVLLGMSLFAWMVVGFKFSTLDSWREMDKVTRAMTNLLILTDDRFNIEKINPAALAFFGVEEQNVLGKSLGNLVDSSTFDSIKAMNLDQKATKDREFVFQKNEEMAHLLVSTSPLFNRANRLVGYALVGADLTRHRNHEKMLSMYAQKVNVADEHLERFAYITSHDLKEPLRNISYYTTKLERELSPHLKNKTSEYFGFITEGVKRMYNLIESIRHVSDIHNTNGEVEEIDTYLLVSKVEERLNPRIAEKGAIIDKTGLPKITGDPTHFELLFFNLIENALKYNQSPKPLVGIRCQMEEGRYVFSVQDNGIGIEPEFYDYVFKMFKRLHSRAVYEGVGMGLAICKSIVEKNGGQIWAETNDSGGTTMKFTLPNIKSNTLPLVQRKLSAVVG